MDHVLQVSLYTLETLEGLQANTKLRRHADKIANFWLTRLRDSPPAKRLNYVYLVNDIVQNARARKRIEFPDAFAPLMPEACQTAYRSSTPEIQSKIRRVVEVWKQRSVFEAPIVAAIDTRLDEIDKAKGSSGRKTLMGKSLYGSPSGGGMPKELETLGPLQTAITKATIEARPLLDTAEREYEKNNDPDIALPTLPVHAANLTGLIKSLAAAESAVNATIKARQALIADLERIISKNKTSLDIEEESRTVVAKRKSAMEAKKRDVEDDINRVMASKEDSPEAPEASHGNGNGKRSTSFVDERPEVEELTPEPEDEPTFSPVPFADEGAIYEETTPSQSPPSNPAVAAALSGFGDTGSRSRVRVASGGSLNGSSAKRRKMSHDEDDAVPDLGPMGMDNLGQEPTGRDVLVDLDADVNELLRQEGGGGL